ncbi:hypothetical protein EDC01DRAFT_635104 [Geopyxis carbonaria]|nr:hypothetical protein EDC01DRAFT_635104 [Geopyxis carbonaria]
MSVCSSPASQRSSYSGCSSNGPHSPHTAATTPSSSNGVDTPKFGTSFNAGSPSLQEHIYTQMQPPSPLSSGTFSASGRTPLASPGHSPYITPMESPSEPVYYQTYIDNQPLPQTYSANSARPRYSGYPPASAFYGPTPGEPGYPSSFSNPTSHYESSSPPIDPSEYKVEDWYTADGQKVEYSAMALHCATM